MVRTASPRSSLLAASLALCAACGGGGSDPVATPTTTPPARGDASLSALAVSAGTLDPAFAPSVASYTLTLANGASALTVTATAAAAGATVAVKDGVSGAFTAAPSGVATLTIPAVGAPSKVTVRVTAPDGATTGDYTLQVSQAARTAQAVTIFSIGDSTMADYLVTTQAGWCQTFPQFLVGDVAVANAAKNGRSSLSFHAEGLWAAVKAKIKAGDYVFIQFGHNDEKNFGNDHTVGTGTSTDIGTAAWGEYAAYLSTYVTETKALGATPVLFTPIVRRDFSGTALTAAARHDLTGNGKAIGDANYPAAMKAVAQRENVALVDLTTLTEQLVGMTYGPTASKELLYIQADDTHLQPFGATVVAQLAAQDLVRQGILGDRLNPMTGASLVVSPTSLEFGPRNAGATADRRITLTGLSLSPAEGDVALSSPDPFLLSTDAAGPFTSALTVPYSGARLAPVSVYVRFAPSAARAYSGDLTLTAGASAPRRVALAGTGLPAPSGTEASATWALTADGSCTSTGAASCEAELLSGITASAYAVPASTTTWVSGAGAPVVPASTLTQKLLPPSLAWPAETSPNPGRYVEFAVRPSAGSSLTVDRISFWAGGAGGNGIGYRALYGVAPDGTTPDFTAGTAATFPAGTPGGVLAPASNVKNQMVFHDLQQAIQVAAGQTLYVRFYPWNSAAATGKHLCLQSLAIHAWGP